MKNKNSSFKTVIKDVISFEVDIQTASDFRCLINSLEEMGVCIDFSWYMDSKFNSDDTQFIHIESNSKNRDLSEIGYEKYHYYKSKIVTVNLDYHEDLYFIFSALYFENFTDSIYNFYEGPEATFVSFFIDKSFYKSEMDKENDEFDQSEILELDPDELKLIEY